MRRKILLVSGVLIALGLIIGPGLTIARMVPVWSLARSVATQEAASAGEPFGLPSAWTPIPTTTAPPAEPTAEPPMPTPESAIPSGYELIRRLTAADEPLELQTVNMIDGLSGWSKTAYGEHILRTVDGARTWRDVSLPGSPPHQDLSATFLDATYAWAVFDVHNPDWSDIGLAPLLVWRTSDGGETWHPSAPLAMYVTIRPGVEVVSTIFEVTAIDFTDRQHGWLWGRMGDRQYFGDPSPLKSVLFHTDDGGETWVRGDYDAEADRIFLDSQGWEMDFVDQRTGLGAPDSGDPPFVLWSTDAGSTWERRELPPPAWDRSFFTRPCSVLGSQLISAVSAKVLVDCPMDSGSRVALYQTEDGTATWEAFAVPVAAPEIWSMKFHDHDNGWLFGPMIYETSDGGRSWRAVKQVGWDQGRFDFVSADLGWAVAEDNPGTGTTERAVVHTEDGGRTWDEIKPRLIGGVAPSPTPTPEGGEVFYVDAMDLMTPLEGWALVDGRLLWTEDGGESWSDITPPVSPDVFLADATFSDTSHGWAVAVGIEDGYATGVVRAYQTSNGGQTWKESPLPAIDPDDVGTLYVESVDSQNAWLVNHIPSGSNWSYGALFRTTDGGASWTELEPPSGSPVSFVTANLGWTVLGPAGDQLFVTRDGGSTWKEVVVVPPETVPGYLIYLLPAFQDSQDGVLPVETNDLSQSAVHFYLTRDGGRSWSPGPTVAVDDYFMPGEGDERLVTVFDANHWVMAGTLPNPPFAISALDFADPDVGWVYTFNGDCSSGTCLYESSFLRTTDGGRTWIELGFPPDG